MKPGWKSIIGISLTAAIFWLVPLAAADEGITLLNGDKAAVKGTTIACTVQTDSLRCGSKSGLTASLSDSGKVQLSKGARPLFPRSVSSGRAKHLRVGVAQGFFVGAGLIFCHVYVGTATTLSCYKSDAKGRGRRNVRVRHDRQSRGRVPLRQDPGSPRPTDFLVKRYGPG